MAIPRCHGYKRKQYNPFAQYEKREPAETEEWADIRTREICRRCNEKATRKRQLCKVFTGESGNSENYKKMHRESSKRWREKNKAKENETKKKYFKKYPEKKKRKNRIANERTMILRYVTNMLAAELSKRQWVGIELNENYINIAKKKLARYKVKKLVKA